MDEGDETFVIATVGESLAGFCSYTAREIVGLYVDPAFTRMRVGSHLLQRAEAQIGVDGANRVVLTAALSALPFYETHGYRPIRRRPWRTRGGLEIEVCDMEKPLC
jgi:GNAT superfamily N-acetyltransferase